MIRTFLYNRTSRELKAGGEELRAAWRQNPDTVIWVDFADEPGDSEKRALLEDFGLHPLAVSDAQRTRHPPKLEAFDNHSFLLLKELSVDSTEFSFETLQLALFVGERFLVTRHAAHSFCIEERLERVRQDPALIAAGPDALAIQLCRSLVDRYLKMLLGLEPRLEQLELDILAKPSDGLLAELLGYKTELKKLRRAFVYHEQVFRELNSKPFPGFGADRKHQLFDLHEHQERAGSLTALYYELASDLIDGYISVASHHLNQIMKVLTVVMSIFVPLSFLAGIYGMNFENMPELHSRSGYFILLGIMASIVAGLLALFRRIRWL
ncbi:MAG: magnesium/cobalt transporter CorA [Thiogranum sp.]|nr:magnesium/cobalt transporter CorA [Thiogranum sp.]